MASSLALFDTSSGSYTTILDSGLLDTAMLTPQVYHPVNPLPLTAAEPFDSTICNTTDITLLESHLDSGIDGGNQTVASLASHLASEHTSLTVVGSHGSWTSETSTVDVRDLVSGPDRLGSVDDVEQSFASTSSTDEHRPDDVREGCTTEEQKVV